MSPALSLLAASGEAPPLPGADSPGPTMSMGDVILTGVVVLVLFLGTMALMTRFIRRAARKEVEAYRPLAEPLYVPEEGGKPTIAAGWYPTPAGDRDRYHDGQAWTDAFRPRTADSRLSDPPPAVSPEDSETARKASPSAE